MRTNTRVTAAPKFTHEGGRAALSVSHEQQLRRAVLACMLWEDTFYENGQDIAARIGELVKHVPFPQAAQIAVEARDHMKLRHAPLLLARELVRENGGRPVGDLIAHIVQRPDELTEFLSLYWKDGKRPLAKQVKLGLARAFRKFDEHQLSKYNRDAAVKLRDVLFLTHAKPKDRAQQRMWKRLIDGKLATADTWETNLSAGADKKETFERLMAEGNLGALAFLRNLRNMVQAGVHKATIKQYAETLNVDRVLPFRFVTAARIVPTLEDVLEPLMMKCLAGQQKLAGNTAILVDVSGSMYAKLSAKAETTRLDAAMGLSILLREICENIEIFTFSNQLIHVAPRRGFALRDAIFNSQHHGGTYLAKALGHLNAGLLYDRCIVITDEQTADGILPPPRRKSFDSEPTRGYVINVGTDKNGVGYGSWLHIDGWSEAVISYIQAYEAAL